MYENTVEDFVRVNDALFSSTALHLGFYTTSFTQKSADGFSFTGGKPTHYIYCLMLSDSFFKG